MKNAKDIFLNADLRRLTLTTDEIIHYYRIYDGVAELSTGEEEGEIIYGVAVVQGGILKEELTKVFHNIDMAKNYIYDLKTPKKTR